VLSLVSFFARAKKETRPRCGEPQLAVEIARKAHDTIQTLLLPGVQQNPLHPFGGMNTIK
jgi:hypothetical protein